MGKLSAITIANAIRPTKLGHKNRMFLAGEHTGWRSAVISTFVEQIRRHGADPFACFERVLCESGSVDRLRLIQAPDGRDSVRLDAFPRLLRGSSVMNLAEQQHRSCHHTKKPAILLDGGWVDG